MSMQRSALTAEQTELITGCQGLVYNVAWTVQQRLGRRLELDELVGFGQVGLVEAARRFDPAWGTRFTTFAYQRVRGAIYDGLKQLPWFDAADFHSGRYQRVAREMVAEQGGDASDGATLSENARWLVDTSVSLSAVYLLTGADSDPTAVSDVRAPAPDEAAMLGEERARLRELLDCLPRELRSLVRMVYFDGLSLTDAGAQLGMNKVKASRRHREALLALAAGLSHAPNPV